MQVEVPTNAIFVSRTPQAQHKVSTLEDNSAMLEQQVESLKGMVSSSESQQQEHAKAQLDKISALQEQVEGLKTSSRKAESECTSLQSRLKAVEGNTFPTQIIFFHKCSSVSAQIAIVMKYNNSPKQPKPLRLGNYLFITCVAFHTVSD